MFNFLKSKYTNLISDERFSEILSGSAWALSARVFSAVLGLAVSIIVARFYGAEMVGIVAVINSFLILTTIFTVLGTGTSILRIIPEHLAKYSPASAFKVYRKSQFMVIGISVVTGAAAFIAADLIADKVFSKPHMTFYFALASVFVVFKSIMLLNKQAVRGLRLIKIFALMQFLPQSCNLGLLALLGVFWPGKNVPVFALLGGYTITGIVGWMVMERTFMRRMSPADNVMQLSAKDILSMSLPMLMTATMNFALGQTGVIMLGIFRSEVEVGYYVIAFKLATLTSFIFSAINTIAAPKFSQLFFSNRIQELFHVAQKSAKLIFWTTVPILIVLLILGKQFLYYFYGKDFTVAYLAMIFLIFGQFVNAISGVTGNFMNMTGHQNQFKNIILIAASINICSNLILIPSYGINGAALSAMASICFWNMVTLIYIKKVFGVFIGYMPISRIFPDNKKMKNES